MTAEVAVLNKSAVALAADSKVSIETGSGTKTYDTVNKVFTLSKVHPVGIMVFGNAEFMRYPWETVIKLYRRQAGDQEHDTVAAWGEDFARYLLKFGKIRPEHVADNIRAILASWFNVIDRRVNAAMHEGGGGDTTPATYAEALRDVLTGHVEHIGREDASAEKDGWANAIVGHQAAIETAIEEAGFPIGDDAALGSLLDAFSKGVLASNRLSPQSSGFVVAGFGRDEYFPALVEYTTDGFVGDSVAKLVRVGTYDVTRSQASAIQAFAQGDVVRRFMGGGDPQLLSLLKGAFAEAMRDSCLEVLNQYGAPEHKTDEVRNTISAAVFERFKGTVEGVARYQHERFVGPIIDMVAMLPKDELAHLAESLVSLTSLQRRVASDVETVGGPVDVALVSKCDGFVWIKRKHYFKPELNQHFLRNYMREIGPGGSHDDD